MNDLQEIKKRVLEMKRLRDELTVLAAAVAEESGYWSDVVPTLVITQALTRLRESEMWLSDWVRLAMNYEQQVIVEHNRQE